MITTALVATSTTGAFGLALSPQPDEDSNGATSAVLAAPAPLGVADKRAMQNARLLIIDDDEINIRIIHKVLHEVGYRHIITHTNSETAVETVVTQRPDVVLCDVCMPVSGMDILRQVVSDPTLVHTPMIMVTASDDEALRTEALELGATDLLSKPVRSTDLVPRIRNALLLRSHYVHLQTQSHQLEQQVKVRTSELLTSRTELIHCLARLAEYRDNETGRHVMRVGKYSGLLARQLGLDEPTAELIEYAAPLHDIGKIGIPDSILLKEGKLTPEEFEIMQRHVALGKRAFEPMSPHEMGTFRSHTVLGEMMINIKSSPLLAMASQIALTHHERWDGSGYPIGLAGEEIPMCGRIVAVADVFDALSNKRPYKPAFPMEKCFAILEEGSGSHFDPKVFEAFTTVRDEIVAVRIALADID
jgi:putative two-component system response regulator